MAHHKSAKKRIRRNQRAQSCNKNYLSTVRSAVKSFRSAARDVAAGDGDQSTLKPLFVNAQSLLAKAATKGVIHRNNADRKIGRLANLLKRVEAGEKAPAAAMPIVKKAKKKGALARKKAAAKKAGSAS